MTSPIDPIPAQPDGARPRPAIVAAPAGVWDTELRELLADVFFEDPGWRRAIPLRWARRPIMHAYYRRALRIAHASGRIDVIRGESDQTPGRSSLAVALWRRKRPTVPVEPEPTKASPSPHWHLQALVVSQRAQHRGFGGALLEHGLAIVDADASVATLDATTPSSQRLYERFGFRPLRPAPELPWHRDLKMQREPRRLA